MAPGVQPSTSGPRRPLVLPAAGAAARPGAPPPPVAALPAHVRPESLPADVPLPAPEPHRPPPHHLPLRRRRAAALPGPLHPAAPGSGAADGAEPRVGPSAAQQNGVRLPPPRPIQLLSAGQVTTQCHVFTDSV